MTRFDFYMNEINKTVLFNNFIHFVTSNTQTKKTKDLLQAEGSIYVGIVLVIS